MILLTSSESGEAIDSLSTLGFLLKVKYHWAIHPMGTWGLMDVRLRSLRVWTSYKRKLDICAHWAAFQGHQWISGHNFSHFISVLVTLQSRKPEKQFSREGHRRKLWIRVLKKHLNEIILSSWLKEQSNGSSCYYLRVFNEKRSYQFNIQFTWSLVWRIRFVLSFLFWHFATCMACDLTCRGVE